MEAWVKKGDVEIDNFSRFICYWIAFNCWLYTNTNEVRDRKALEKLYQNHNLYKNFRKIVKENRFLLEKLLDVCPVENSRNYRKKTIKNLEEFREVVDVLYQVRCNLFHGSKLDIDKRDCDVIKVSMPVLELIVKNLVLNEIETN